MIRQVTYMVLFVGFSIALGSCKSEKKETASQTCAVGEVEGGQSLLWEISGNGLTEKSYLFGTIHIIAEDKFFLGDGLMCRFNKADKLVMELNMELEELVKAQKAMMLPDNKTLDDELPAELVKELRQVAMDSFGINEAMFEASFNKMKPIFAWQNLALSQLQKNSKSYEIEFSTKAREKEIPILGLESALEQVGFFDAIPLEKQIALIDEGLDEWDESEAEFEKLVDMYLLQDVEGMHASFQEVSPEFMEFEDLLLNDRNKNWVKVLETWMREGSLFIAVGAGHLGGEEGLIKLLKEANYSLTPVSTKG